MRRLCFFARATIGIHVSRLAVQMDRDDGLGPRRDLRLDLRDVNVVGRCIAVTEDDLRPRHFYGFGGGHERVGHGDHLVSGANTQGLQREEERVGPVGNADAIARSTVARETLLELLDVRPSDEGRLRDDRRNRVVDLPLDGPVLSVQIYERNTCKRFGCLHRQSFN